MALRQEEAYGSATTGELRPTLVAPSQDGTVDVARDRDLVERCQAGDRSAFEELYLRYQRRLHRFCMQRLGESGDAEDVVQETFARAWRALPRFAGERRFYPWLTVIAANLCVDTLRRRSRQTPVEESRLQAADIGTYDTEDAVLRDVDSKMVAQAFGQLSERHQRVLQLREGSDWSYRQIAEHEGVGITAVETLLWRARQALKREFMLLDNQRGRLGSLAGFLVLLRMKVLGSLVITARHPLVSVRQVLRHLASSADRLFGTSGALGTFGPVAAAATGVAVLGVGTLMLAPTTPSHPAPAVPAHPAVAGSGTAPASSRTGAGASVAGGGASVAGPASGSGGAAASSGTSRGSGGSSANGSPVNLPGVGGGVGGATSPTPGVPSVSGAAGQIGGTVKSTASGVGSTVAGAAGGLGSTAAGAVGGVSSTVSGAVGGVGSTVSGATSGVGSTVTTTAAGATSTVTKAAGSVTGTLGLPPLTGSSSSSSSSGSSGVLGLGG